MTEKQTNRQTATENPEKWVDLYGDYLYRYAYSRTMNPAVAEDLVQETFLAALKARHTFKGTASLKTWLTSILKNKTIDYFRSINREQPPLNLYDSANPVEDLFNKSGMWREEPAQWQGNPYKKAEDKQFWHTIESCLTHTPERLAHAFALRELNELSTEEICDIMGISPSNCWVLLHRARLYMKECLTLRWFSK